MRDQIVALKAENAELKKQLAAAGGGPVFGPKIKSFTERAEEAAKKPRSYKPSKSEIDSQIKRAQRIDDGVSKFLASPAAAKLDQNVTDLIKQGKVDVGVPYDAAKLYCSSDRVSANESSQTYVVSVWEPFGLQSTEDAYTITVRDGIIRSVTIFVTPPSQGDGGDPRLFAH